MNQVASDQERFMSTLRLSIIDSCNGICPFCHKEGQKESCSNQLLTMDSIRSQIIPAIISVGIKKVIITGGEPSLHPQLSSIARSIKEKCPHVQIGLTTNGYNPQRISETVKYLDRVTISLSSFRPEVFLNYTQVEPRTLISFIDSINPQSKAASIVITEDNYFEITELITFLVKHTYDVKLQFVIGSHSFSQEQKYQVYRMICNEFGNSEIILSSTPTLCWRASSSSIIRLKLDSLNHFIYDYLAHRKICINCPLRKDCVERGCAVRVYPNGKVSPCLNNHVSFQSDHIKESIEKAYDAIEIL